MTRVAPVTNQGTTPDVRRRGPAIATASESGLTPTMPAMPADPPARQALIADVAQLAGVSPMTVSRVLNAKDGVRGDTRDRVLRAVTALNYRPNHAARTLSSGRSRAIGVITMEGAMIGPTSTLTGIEHEARSLGYTLSVAILGELTPAAVADAVDSLRGLAVAGIVLSAPHTGVDDSLLTGPNPPMVAVEGFRGHVPVVAVDQRDGAVLATRHLIDLGHRVICHIAGPDDRFEALEREQGWRDALAAAGLPAGTLLRGDWSPQSGYDLAGQLLEGPPATAVVVANDQMAVGVLRRLSEAGVDVPRQMSVVGFDDIAEAPFLRPSLTTVHYDFYELGRRTFRRLMDTIDEPAGHAPETSVGADSRTVIEPTLIVRESTAPPHQRPPVRRR